MQHAGGVLRGSEDPPIIAIDRRAHIEYTVVEAVLQGCAGELHPGARFQATSLCFIVAF